MTRILFIAMPIAYSNQLKESLLNVGIEAVISNSEEETEKHLLDNDFDAFMVEPFSNFQFSAKIIRQLNELKLINRLLLFLPGIRAHEDLTAKKIVGNNYFSRKDSFEILLEKIRQLGSENTNQSIRQPVIHNPIIHYIKSEIEKAKRGKTSLSFLYYQVKKTKSDTNNSQDIINKINSIIHERLRISDEAFPFQKGVLVLLFGTHAQDRHKIKDAIQNKVKQALSEEKISYEDHFEITEATYPIDGLSYKEILQILEDPSLVNPENTVYKPQVKLNEILGQTEIFEKSFRIKRKYWEMEANNTSAYIAMSCMPPTWFGALTQICNDTRYTNRSIEDFIKNETNISERLFIIANALIKVFPLQYTLANSDSPTSIADLIQILGLEEFKNLIFFCAIEKMFLVDTTPRNILLKQAYMQIAIALELSKRLDYTNKPELILCLFCQITGYMLTKRKNPDLYNTIFEKQKSSGTPLGKLFFDELKFTPSELSFLILKRWGLDEQILESAHCARYECPPLCNPQLTAITHLSIFICNHLQNYNFEHNLKISKLSLDEILLRNRGFNFESINYLLDYDAKWKNEYDFIFEPIEK